MTSLRVEGWRGINHSYAMVNQYQLLELLDYDGLTISHRDMPFYNAAWSPERNPSGFDAERLRRIQSIPAADDAGAVAVLRPGVVGRVRGCAAGASWCEVRVGEHRGWIQREGLWGISPGETVGN